MQVIKFCIGSGYKSKCKLNCVTHYKLYQKPFQHIKDASGIYAFNLITGPHKLKGPYDYGNVILYFFLISYSYLHLLSWPLVAGCLRLGGKRLYTL